ncbi:thermonuclease family protein [Methylobacterium aerolatum]|uniref:Endonuclease YncB(Thermonuclease family) n=1 Tax=Methylobacterium aerolatum TaxID=418708 RepID=A0ABU0I3Y7_9HYPH|nr:nuclease [Methylobacterium aerolatum]MDQ0448406.1 endonuclease YncB(thermonuclease family) [Methylobacterium aerolatum]GJD34488.1 hypothetical protein FMGBMHLM_1389 [Methylobacterium aerolatum]
MTSSTGVAEQEARPAHPQLESPDRAALLATLRTEIAKARPYPVAERTLTLIAQAALEPQAAPPGYRVIDRDGAPRRHAAAEGEEARPFTLADLLDELRAQHPGLFQPPEPVKPADPVPEPRDASRSVNAAEMRAATARFLGTQSERARTLAEQSSVQGRALAQSAAGAFASLKQRMNKEPSTEAGSAEAVPPAAAPPAGEPAGRFAGSVNGADDLDRSGGGRRRMMLWGGGAAAAAAALVAVLASQSPPSETPSPTPAPSAPSATPPAAKPTAKAPPAEPSAVARAPSVPDNVTPPPEGDGRGDSDGDAPPPAANAVTGTVQVIDTATLKLNGKLVHLFGVEWVRGGQAEELTRYIAGRPVTCQPAPGSESMNCSIDGRDLSEVILYNGGGRASPEASPELVAAEDHARSERLGVWKR